ncbi:hypothetical protein ACCO45_004322 [Purpureocillium lilacinum]|uniref:Uncharacterized protein n=1 Tax=Purpureocillium lilacinum TaxID=33203 RepID=A0ACC4E3T8_PURLI
MRGLLTLLLGSLVPCSFAAAASSPPSPSSDYHEQLNLRPLPLNSPPRELQLPLQHLPRRLRGPQLPPLPAVARADPPVCRDSGAAPALHVGPLGCRALGSAPWDGTREGGTGVELWAWLDAKTDAEAAENWLTLTNALSGLFCASLNFIDETRTIRPVVSFQPEGDHDNATLANLRLLHGLLPCKGKAGIASLLDGHKLFDASFQSMAIDVRPICPPGGEGCVLEMEQTIDMVLDVDRSKRPRDNPIPRPPPADQLVCDTSKSYHNDETCYPVDHLQGQDWTLSEIFGRTMKGTCPLSNPDEAPGTHEVKSKDGMLRCYTMPQDSDFTLVLAKPEPDDAAAGRGPPRAPHAHPPHCTVFLTYDFEKSILRYTEYPPDANRGFDVAAAVITTRAPRRGLNLRTTSLLLYLPTPDFSMPYNVIIFTSTAIALTFGGLYNILVRRLVGADEAPPPVLKAKLAALMGRLKGLKK